jgi:hypothetical protein
LFVLSALVYPAVVALLCLGAGLAVDRASGGFLPGALLGVVGLAALIGVAELTTYVYPIATATPYVLAAVGAAGLVVGWPRLRVMRWRDRRWPVLGAALAFVIAAAPVLFAGRPTFSAYMVLTDSALHMMGADYLVRHGQHYAHLDLVNSYGQYIYDYYSTGYPTGADALLGGTAVLLRVPVIWAFQPFNAFALALAYGPAWLLAKRLGLRRGWAIVAALAVALPALVYAYELIGSIKEITSLSLILTLGVLVTTHERWLWGRARAAIPFAIVVAGGVSALGLAFGAWTIGAVLVLLGVILADRAQARRHARQLLALTGTGALVLLIAAWPTWRQASGALSVAQAVAGSANRGNLVTPLRAVQVFGTWLEGSYQVTPRGVSLLITDVAIGVTVLACVLGALHLARTRRYALAAWLALMILLGVLTTRLGGTWSDAKTLALSSSVFVLLAWGGVCALLRGRRRGFAVVLALALAGGVLASDFVQYRDTDLAPTARYDELASIGTRFAGRGPTLVTDFDEYTLYELRDMDVGGPDFLHSPQGLGIDVGHGNYVNLTHARAAALRRYPLIVTRRDPTAIRPPSAYRLLWQGTYYDVWGRTPGAPAAIARMRLTGKHVVACSRVRAIARVALAHSATLVTAAPAEVVEVDLKRARRPAAWRRDGPWYVMASPGRLTASFTVPHAGAWNLWLQGEFMPDVVVHVDGRLVASLGGQFGGDAVVPDTTAPVRLRLSAARHRLTVALTGSGVGPGDGGAADLTAIFLTPVGAGERQQVRSVSPTRWRSLCGHRYVWIEAVPPVGPSGRLRA